MWIGPHAPHGPAIPAEWYGNKFMNITAPRTPNYNFQSHDKIDYISNNPSLISPSNSSEYIDQEMRDRLRTLLSVDDIVDDIFKILNKYPDILNNTYIIYTSDHGYHLGQWRVPHTKHLPYDTDIRVPMFMRGPNIKPGSISYDVVGNIDILPTILSLAGIKYDADNDYDGMSWTQIFDGEKWKRQIYLPQYISIHTASNGGGCWFPNDDGSTYPGQEKGAGCCYDQHKGQAYMLDDQWIGNWRALRIINETNNNVYIEWYQLQMDDKGDVIIMWNETIFDTPYHFEYYDLKDDIWQINNLYKELGEDLKNELHEMLMTRGVCKGSNQCT